MRIIKKDGKLKMMMTPGEEDELKQQAMTAAVILIVFGFCAILLVRFATEFVVPFGFGLASWLTGIYPMTLVIFGVFLLLMPKSIKRMFRLW
jgi:hypothetical protein